MVPSGLHCSIFAVAAAGFSSSFAQTLPADSQLAFTRAHQMVDIGGRRLNLHCSGQGPVTVVFDAFSGGAGSSWFAVQPHVAQHTRACVYDRAGLGFSDPAPRPSTSANVVEDLHQLLAAAKIAPPCLLVGSSFGGASVQLYAYRFPSEVKGMVLVEPQHEDEIERQNKVTGGKMKQMYAMFDAMSKACFEQSEKGFVAGSDLARQCLGSADATLGSALAASQMALRMQPKFWSADMSESANFGASGEQLRAARKSFGDMPLVVLSRGVSPYAVPGKPQSAMNKAVEQENQAMMKEVAAHSSKGVVRQVPGSGHVIHETKPMAVVDAIVEVLGQIAN